MSMKTEVESIRFPPPLLPNASLVRVARHSTSNLMVQYYCEGKNETLACASVGSTCTQPGIALA
eukprot:41113-Rhodomonas_salina.1